jgi:hypothetical protein
MNGEGGIDKELGSADSSEEGVEVVEDFDGTVVMSEDSVEESLGQSSEINVDKLVADVEALKGNDAVRKQLEARKRLDEIALEGDDELGSTYNFNINDDLLK